MALAVVAVEHRILADQSLGSLDSPGSWVAFHSLDLADNRGLVHSLLASVPGHIRHSSAWNHRHRLEQTRFESHWSCQVFP